MNSYATHDPRCTCPPSASYSAAHVEGCPLRPPARNHMILTAVQHYVCGIQGCGAEDETVQSGEAHIDGEPLRFGLKLPPGWHVLDGRSYCSPDCTFAAAEALALTFKARP